METQIEVLREINYNIKGLQMGMLIIIIVLVLICWVCNDLKK